MAFSFECSALLENLSSFTSCSLFKSLILMLGMAFSFEGSVLLKTLPSCSFFKPLILSFGMAFSFGCSSLFETLFLVTSSSSFFNRLILIRSAKLSLGTAFSCGCSFMPKTLPLEASKSFISSQFFDGFLLRNASKYGSLHWSIFFKITEHLPSWSLRPFGLDSAGFGMPSFLKMASTLSGLSSFISCFGRIGM